MDENLSKVITIACGLLISILVIGLLITLVNKLSVWSEGQNEEEKVRQADEFNKKYEAYDKNLMFGVDVISCLGSVKDLNDKIDNNRIGENLDSSYEIKVSVKLNKALSESISVYYIKDKSEFKYAISDDACKDITLKEAGFTFFEKNAINNSFPSEYKEDSKLITSSNENIVDAGTYELNKDTSENDVIVKLINSVTYMSSIVHNKADNGATKWSKAEYRSVAYDFKTRKFKCTGVGYDIDTGRINEISFEEY